MAVMKRNGHFYIYFRPFKDKKIGLRLDVVAKNEAKYIEATILKACRSGSYSGLDTTSKEAVVRMFQNQGWELPEELAATRKPEEELTLRRACELFLKYPGISHSKTRWRYEIALCNLVEALGADRSLKTIWVPDLRAYQIERQAAGAASDTVNREIGCLSKLFGVMQELRYLDTNPARLVKGLSNRGAERQGYLSQEDVDTIANLCPEWFRLMIWTAFFTGMRRGEIANLTRKQVNLSRRMIYLSVADTKEGAQKRIPLRTEAEDVLRQTLDRNCISTDKVFSMQDHTGTRPPTIEAVKNCWPRACEKLGLEKPWPRFHDLRHSWRANARRSGMDWTIAEKILGHSSRKASVAERYGYISDEELLAAVDAMTFDHGESMLSVGGVVRAPLKKGNWMVTGTLKKKKGQGAT